MGKKRDRRVTPNSNKGGEQRVELGDSASSNRRLAIIFVLFFIVSPAISVLVYRIKYAPTTNPTDSYVFQRGLVKANVDFQEILAENSKVSENTSHRHYNYPVLAYITPWNSKGYEIAKRFNSKFTHLSPVWYDLKSQGTGLILEGRHNADVGWISELRRSGDAWVLPRVVLEAFPAELLTRKKQRDKAIKLIVTECKDMGYDGIVLEAWSRWAAYGLGGGAITGRDYLSLLEKHRPLLQWEKNSGEHLFFYSNDDNIKHAVFYPSLLSISMLLEEARSWGCGISIWEIGQVPPEISTGFCSTFETGLDCSDFLYDLAFSEASFTGSIEAGSGSGVVSGEFGDMGSEDSALDWFVEDDDFLYDLAFSEASFTGSIEAGSGSGVVSGEFGDMGSEDSALDWFVEDE
nr:isoform 2 of chitinase domain-containing protein 1 [Quercus suber]